MCAKLARCKKRAGLIGPDPNKKKPGRPSIGWRPAGEGGGGGGGGGGAISAEEGQYLLADYVRGRQFPLTDYVRGDRICSDTAVKTFIFHSINRTEVLRFCRMELTFVTNLTTYKW